MTDFNPWLETNLDKFLLYCCPECDVKKPGKKEFLLHALQSHSKARKVYNVSNEKVPQKRPMNEDLKTRPSKRVCINDISDQTRQNTTQVPQDPHKSTVLEETLKTSTTQLSKNSEATESPKPKIAMKDLNQPRVPPTDFSCNFAKSWHLLMTKKV